ncbi:MAG: ATP-binding protein [Candidatus Omnitrophota bacterium]
MTKDIFFGRQDYLNILEKRISDLRDGYRQNIAIIGDELIGKTSIIFKFLDKFYDNRIISIYLEIRPESLASFAKRFIAVLLYNFLNNSGMHLEEDLEFLIKKSEKFIPRTIEKIMLILSSLERRKNNNIFIELLSLCEIIKQETNKSCVVIFDEFQNLENLGIKNLYPEWSKILISQKNTMYVIISSLKFKTKAILSKNLSLLFGNFEIITVEPFDTKKSEGYLGQLLGGLNIDSGLKNFLVHLTGGNPFYLGLIAKELLKPDVMGLADILEGLLFMPSGMLNQKFSNYLKRFLDSSYSQDYITILYLISDGHNKIKDIAHILRRQKKELTLRLNHLLELDTISRSGDFLKINDRVFSFWLKFVYQEKIHSLTFDAKNQKILFRDKIGGMIKDFLINAERSIAERTAELLRLFEDEVMQMDKKRIRLSRFREIKSLEFNTKGLKEGVIGRSHDNLWIIAFKNDLLTERDITEFSRECKKYRHKIQKKIIVALQDIDQNTRLKALEEKVWTWDLNNLNQILDLFYKPRIIA